MVLKEENHRPSTIDPGQSSTSTAKPNICAKKVSVCKGTELICTPIIIDIVGSNKIDHKSLQKSLNSKRLLSIYSF